MRPDDHQNPAILSLLPWPAQIAALSHLLRDVTAALSAERLAAAGLERRLGVVRFEPGRCTLSTGELLWQLLHITLDGGETSINSGLDA
ncbi:hypothetical protein N8J89_05600 [Crossiella sp. CA-258035]|uniref:hypothetical protein n=1 Tax=Crossiella sp. CA-258035 TaxID=2981138 RepID=UPI0024BC728E|nr:hypothetical protein [Crossiella sp. CA-258035]WHT20544.1 hypothetical protein N8J89_05600 [Crossiella sp. CA-258035]